MHAQAIKVWSHLSLLVNFCRQILFILIGIHVGILCKAEWFPHSDFGSSWSQLVEQKASWFESDFCVSFASYIAILLTIELFCPQYFAENSHLWPYLTQNSIKLCACRCDCLLSPFWHGYSLICVLWVGYPVFMLQAENLIIMPEKHSVNRRKPRTKGLPAPHLPISIGSEGSVCPCLCAVSMADNGCWNKCIGIIVLVISETTF